MYPTLDEKREQILEAISPIFKVFNIKNYDYIITSDGREILKINDTCIGCSCNSISAVLDEVIGFLLVKVYCKQRSLGHFETQALNRVKRYWIENEPAPFADGTSSKK